jgi:hypothetical protein
MGTAPKIPAFCSLLVRASGDCAGSAPLLRACRTAPASAFGDLAMAKSFESTSNPTLDPEKRPRPLGWYGSMRPLDAIPLFARFRRRRFAAALTSRFL